MEHPENIFADAKKHGLEVLDTYPVDVILRFINQSWRLIFAYQKV